GLPYDTILLVGENGVGKTTILTEISNFLGGNVLYSHFSRMEYNAGENNDAFIITIVDESNPYLFNREVNSQNEMLEYGWLPNSGRNIDKMNNDMNDPRYYGSLISLPRSAYRTKQISNVGVSELDTSIHEKDTENDFTSLKQLLVDLSGLDSEDFTEQHRLGNPISISEFEESSRMSRFTKAFNNFFDAMKFSCIKGENGHKEIYFSKYGNEIPIDSLSTGEKQIVFRGIFLLRNLNKLKGGILLIDEPELSLHPKWQNKILRYYQTLFTDPTSGNLQVQLILATHSERILSSAFDEPNKNGVITLRNEGGNISASIVNAPGVLPSVTSAETIYLAYDVPTVDYHIELFSYIQRINASINGELNVKQTDDYILNHATYNPITHARPDAFTNPRTNHTTNYATLPTFIRNRIDHPNPQDTFTSEQLKLSIELMREIIQNP
ncbi:MAG: ATP-binding protein, partial [Clostridia bacterium]|nr:ATP-binding protein [Clostridia bacterium]